MIVVEAVDRRTGNANLSTYYNCVGGGYCGFNAVHFMGAIPEEREALRINYQERVKEVWYCKHAMELEARTTAIIQYMEEAMVPNSERILDRIGEIVSVGKSGAELPTSKYLTGEEVHILTLGQLPFYWEYSNQLRMYQLSLAPHHLLQLPIEDLQARIPRHFDPMELQIKMDGNHFTITGGIDISSTRIGEVISLLMESLGEFVDGIQPLFTSDVSNNEL